MALTTYANLLSAIQNWTHRSDLGTYDDDFVTLAESRINNELRVRQNETVVASTMSSGVISVPSDYVEAKDFRISSTTPNYWLERKSAEWIYANYPDRSATGTPSFWARDGGNFVFGKYPDSDYVCTLNYYHRLPALSGTVHSVFTSYPGLYLFAALAETAPFLKDDKRVVLWEAKYQDILKKVQAESDREMYSGSVLSVKAG